MKLALLGAGKTGSKILNLHDDVEVFNSKRKPTIESLRECDVIVSFLTGDIFVEYIPLLIESKVPVVTGSTGFEWPENIQTSLQDTVWIKAHNFSLGMNLVKSLIEKLSQATELYPEAKFSIHDIHHTKKIDSPSGTALSWGEWLGRPHTITAERAGDVVGYHHMEMESQVEKIKVTHEALDRSIFAAGALWAAKKICTEPNKYRGLVAFDKVVTEHLNI